MRVAGGGTADTAFEGVTMAQDVEGILFPSKDGGGVKLDVKFPAGLVEEIEAKAQALSRRWIPKQDGRAGEAFCEGEGSSQRRRNVHAIRGSRPDRFA